MAEEINKTYTSNSLYNDSTGVIAFAEQLKQELINWANYQHVTEELGQNRPDLQNELNNLFLSVYERFLTFLNDADTSEEAINTWKEIENFLADYTDEKTLASIVAEFNNKIESRLTVPLESTTGSSTTSTMTQKAITETIDASKTFTTGEKVDNVGIDSEPTDGSDNLVKSGGVQNELALGAVYDVSAHNGGAVFESLSALLSNANLNTLIPTAVRKGGMSIKFIQGSVPSSDNKYVQYRLIGRYFTTDWHQWVEMGIDGYEFIGTPSPSSIISTPTSKVFYLLEKGTYENFGTNPIIVPDGYYCVVRWDGYWSSRLIKVTDRTFDGLFSEDSSSELYFDNITNIGIYKRTGNNVNPRILTVLEYGGIITQVMESYDVTKNEFRIYTRTKQDNVWSDWINLLDDNLTMPIVHSYGRIEINDNSITFVGGGVYYQKYNRKAINNNSSVTFTSNGSYRLYVNNGSLAFVSTETNLDVLDYPPIAFVQYKDGIIRSITWNVFGKVINNAMPTTADFIKMPSNLIEKFKTGYYLSNDGAMIKSPMWETYIVKMKSGDVLSAHLSSVDTFPLIIAAYSNITCNANYYINGVSNVAGIHDYRYVALQDCYVVICNRPATLGAIPTIELYSKFSYEEHKDNFINVHTQTIYNDMLDSTGAWINNFGKHIKIPVNFCEQYTIEAIGNNVNYDFLEEDENYSSADGFRHTLQSGTNIKVLVPYSAKYLYIQVGSYDGSTDFFFNALVTKNNKFILNNKDNIELVNIEYSVLSDMPGNSLPHFIRAISDGFKYLKADMHITSDNKVVLCHDEGFTFDGNGDIIAFDANDYTSINTLTLAQIKTHKFAQQVDGQNVYPCSLDEFIVLCKKYGIVPFLTVRYSDYSSTVPVSRDILYKYGLENFAIYNLFLLTQELYEVCSYINSIDNTIKKCYTIGSETIIVDEKYLALAFENRCEFMDIWKRQESYIVGDIRNIASKQNTRILSMIGSETEFNDSVVNGMDGFQNYTRNTYQQIT